MPSGSLEPVFNRQVIKLLKRDFYSCSTYRTAAVLLATVASSIRLHVILYFLKSSNDSHVTALCHGCARKGGLVLNKVFNALGIPCLRFGRLPGCGLKEPLSLVVFPLWLFSSAVWISVAFFSDLPWHFVSLCLTIQEFLVCSVYFEEDVKSTWGY